MIPISADVKLFIGRVRLFQSHPSREPVSVESDAFNARKCSSNSNQRGLTLFELLIALALISLMALMATGGMRSASPHLAVRLASEQMLADLKRARLEADAANAPVTINITADNYAISALGMTRSLPRGVTISFADDSETDITIGPGYWLKGYEIALSKGDAQSLVTIEPITRRITLK